MAAPKMPEHRRPIIPSEAYLPSKDIKLTRQVAEDVIKAYSDLGPEAQKTEDNFKALKKVLNLAQINDGQFMGARVLSTLTLAASSLVTVAQAWYIGYLQEHAVALKNESDFILRLMANLAGTGLGTWAILDSVKLYSESHKLRYGISKYTIMQLTSSDHVTTTQYY